MSVVLGQSNSRADDERMSTNYRHGTDGSLCALMHMIVQHAVGLVEKDEVD